MIKFKNGQKIFCIFLTLSTLVFSGCSKNQSNSDTAEPSSSQAEPVQQKELKKPIDKSFLTNLKSEKDEMRDITFYSHKSEEVYGNSDVYLYIAEKNDDLGLRLFLKYFGDDWLFVGNAWTKLDNQRVDLPTADRWVRDNTSGFVWETSDVLLTDEQALAIKRFANAESPTIRFEGNEYYKDFKPSKKRLSAMKEVIKAYEAAKGINLD